MTNLEAISSSPRRARVIWTLVAALFGLLNLFQNALHIADREVWLDEASTYGVAARSLLRNLTLPIEFHSQPPLYYVILHALIPINSSEWFLRGFSWLLVLGLIQFVLWGLDELSPSARAFFAFCLVYGGFTHYLAQELRPYALSALTTFASTILFTRAVRAATRNHARDYAIMALVMLYTLAFDVWVFAAHCLFLVGLVVVRSARRGARSTLTSLRPLIIAVSTVALLYLPYVIAAHRWQSDIGRPSWRASVLELFNSAHYTGAFQSFLPMSGVYAFALYGLVLLSCIVDVRERRADFILWLLIVVGQIAFVHAFMAGRHDVATRYYTPAYPALLFLVARGLHHAFCETKAFWWIAPLVLFALVVNAYGPFAVSASTPLAGGRWRSLHRALAAIPGRKLIFFDVGYNGQMLQYEARQDHDLVLALQKGARWASGGDNHLDPEYVAATIASAAPSTHCFFFVVDAPQGPYATVFLPEMQRLGYHEAASPGEGVKAFCDAGRDGAVAP